MQVEQKIISEDFCLGKEEIKTLNSEDEQDIISWCVNHLKKIPDRVFHPSGYVLLDLIKANDPIM